VIGLGFGDAVNACPGVVGRFSGNDGASSA
jgi:hypothetical protein